MPYVYEPREGIRSKHKWKHSYPGEAPKKGSERIGLCPSGIPQATLNELLNTGIQYRPEGWDKPHPKAIYNVYQGVPYRALPTNPERSYHGFPCLDFGKDIPKRILKELRLRTPEEQRAKFDGWVEAASDAANGNQRSYEKWRERYL